MNFTEATYPVDREKFERITTRRGLNYSAMGATMGYSKSAVGEALRHGRFSRRLAAAIFASFNITPNDYAPKVANVDTPPKKPEVGVMQFDAKGREVRLDGTAKPVSRPVDAALLADGVYTLEFVDVRLGRRSGDKTEGYRFVTIASNEVCRQPYYFALYNREPGGVIVNQIGEEWIRHLLRVALGDAYTPGCAVTDIIGHSVRAYVMIYEKGGKRYNRTVWVEPVNVPVELVEPQEDEIGWPDVLNAGTDTETLFDAMEFITAELRERSKHD